MFCGSEVELQFSEQWTVGPRRSVNSFLTAPSRNILTYLLTYLLYS